MKGILRYLLLISAVVTACNAFAQPNFKTVVPQRPIVVGESIQIQYVVENGEEVSNFISPLFPGFEYVTGPNVYSGKTVDKQNRSIRYKNMVITVVATRTGRFMIRGANCIIDGKTYTSNDVPVYIISQQQADELRKRTEAGKDDAPFFLAPGEDPMEKIRKNLFLKLELNKRVCQVGEPIVATFKLYSRLQSVSDIIKNPGFYGFGVSDMSNVNDKVQSVEKVNGNLFDVHTVRKVQLYPLQAGTFTIDPMEVSNKVEFSRSEVNKQTEQEVLENMYGKDETDKPPTPGTEMYEMDVRTEPVTVTVKPLPTKNLPDTFAGAVGNFTISVSVEKKNVLRNEQNALIITLNGAGNFQTINAPTVDFPSKLDAFDPTIADSLDKTQVPLKGSRSFKYVFVSDTPGQYTIPPAKFTFFNPATKSYKTISTIALNVVVDKASKAHTVVNEEKRNPVGGSGVNWKVIVLGTLAVALIAVYLIRARARREKEEKQKALLKKQIEEQSALPTVNEVLLAAQMNIHVSDKQFYRELSYGIWNYFQQRLKLTSSQINKSSLSKIFPGLGIDASKADELVSILQDCETGIYTDAELLLNKEELYERTRSILQQIEKSL